MQFRSRCFEHCGTVTRLQHNLTIITDLAYIDDMVIFFSIYGDNHKRKTVFLAFFGMWNKFIFVV